jgi:uncharacterized protein (TIGR01777 family)
MADHFTGNYGIVNLAGENIGVKCWTGKQKNRILFSRVQVTEAISEMIEIAAQKPKVIIQASAVGYYGSCGDAYLDEDSGKGHGFLAEVVNSWEQSLNPEATRESRIVFIRTAPVFGSGGGSLPYMIMPFKLFFGGKLGNGNQWFPWIHIWDLVNAILHLFNRQDLSGPFNLSAPAPVRNREFAESVSLVLNRPNWFHIPAIVLKAALSERAEELLLTSQRVVPIRLIESGYEFRFDRIEAALRDLLSKSEVNE